MPHWLTIFRGPELSPNPEVTHQIMDKRIIEWRAEIEVLLGPTGRIVIAQDTGLETRKEEILIHRDDFPRFLQHLQATYQEALSFVPECPKETESRSDD